MSSTCSQGCSDGMTHSVDECQHWGLACGSVPHGQPGQHNSIQPRWAANTHTHTGGTHSWSGSSVYSILRFLCGCHGAGVAALLNIVLDGREFSRSGVAPLSRSVLQMLLCKDGKKMFSIHENAGTKSYPSFLFCFTQLKQMKELEQEKDSLLAGLEVVERARDWYQCQIHNVTERQRQVGQSSACTVRWNGKINQFPWSYK